MPFDEEGPKEFKPKFGLKKIEGQKSMFDGQPRKPTQQEFQQKVQSAQDTLSGYKKKAADLFVRFNKSMSDKTLIENKNLLHHETERELLQNMIQLAIDINNDPNEQEGMGSVTWITLLFKTCFAERDRINKLEYNLSLLQNKLVPDTFSELIKKEIKDHLDKSKDSE